MERPGKFSGRTIGPGQSECEFGR
jgi:hypothetical protein